MKRCNIQNKEMYDDNFITLNEGDGNLHVH